MSDLSQAEREALIRIKRTQYLEMSAAFEEGFDAGWENRAALARVPDSIEWETRPCFVAANGDLLMLTDEQAETIAKLLAAREERIGDLIEMVARAIHHRHCMPGPWEKLLKEDREEYLADAKVAIDTLGAAREDTERPDDDPVVSGFVGGLEAPISRANAERDARLTFEEARERMLAAIEGARQALVAGPSNITGDLFSSDPAEYERQVVKGGVHVIALKDFNDALDKAFPVLDTEQEHER